MASATGGFTSPKSGASLLLSFSFRSQWQASPPFLILGSGPLAAQRAFAALEADASVIVLGKGGLQNACEEIRWRVTNNQIGWVDLDSLLKPTSEDAPVLEHYLTITPLQPKFLCVTDTLLSLSTKRRSRASATQIYNLCRSKNILVNTTDYPNLCDFSFSTTFRFSDRPNSESLSFSSQSGGGNGGWLQVAITTNGQGCRLAGRIKREIVARLPRDIGCAVGNVGRMRTLAKERDMNKDISRGLEAQTEDLEKEEEDVDPCADTDTPSTPNLPVAQRPLARTSPSPSTETEVSDPSEAESVLERTRRRMKWIAQISEYWPLEKLAAMTEEEMRRYLEDGDKGECLERSLSGTSANTNSGITSVPNPGSPLPLLLPPTSIHSLQTSPLLQTKPGQIFLIGSGPGHPSLLTIAAHYALTKLADIVLADKLVPAPVLALIPKTVEVVIARKFPGNADRAQEEMMERAVYEARKGKCVVRLKQGDPSIYGRFGEEVLYFRNPPLSPPSPSPSATSPSPAPLLPLPPTLVIPGVSSALAAPTMFDIPCTQRGVATSFIVTTPVGKGGKELRMPLYERGRTVVVLMGVARLSGVVGALLGRGTGGTGMGGGTGTGRGMDPVYDSNQGGQDPPPEQCSSYPSYLPIAIIERASMADQRVVESTLGDVESAMESTEVGGQRPPGLMVVGWSVCALWGVDGNVDVLDTDGGEAKEGGGGSKGLEGIANKQRDQDIARVRRWLGDGVRWRVREGLSPVWDMFNVS
ncbi:hypothetical protein D9757_007850 [Collybiopsis confluens]|uniref:precorrin-2 dehydrogenase n=1 Tax=Collybiopsis confluens TaxID=2823264 RepID=A0A8H5HCU8_9AGAR|nr:hypothetical protein D9757_007850 [Collybiopsis confluens]